MSYTKNHSVTFDNNLVIGPNESAFISFIGRTPPSVVIGKTSKVWQVVRCGALYHYDGVVSTITPENSAELFCHFYNIDVRSGGWIKLYKRTMDNFTDYFSGKYKYLPGTKVTANDWIPNERIICGNALHLAPTKELSEQWNEGGLLLKCEVNINDLCVCPYNISQIRCREVSVLHASWCHYIHFENEECDCRGDST